MDMNSVTLFFIGCSAIILFLNLIVRTPLKMNQQPEKLGQNRNLNQDTTNFS